MRFHALLPVRDEADIIGACLDHLLQWADGIHVFDTGSVDETWDIVQDKAARDKRIVPLRREPVYFSEGGLRGWIFHQARRHMREGDWFLRVDADEFHHVLPPEFVATHMRRHETIAWHQYYDFHLTASEAQAWETGMVTLKDRQRPIEDRRRWFTQSTYSEPRLCRYRETMRWTPATSFPYNAGYVARERLPIRHYPNRDPVQMSRRCRLRAVMMADPANRAHWSRPEAHHWSEGEWRKFVVPDDRTDLQWWQPDTPFPVRPFPAPRAPLHKRVIQRLVHGLCLPLLDRTRPSWPEDATPQKITPEIVSELMRELGKSEQSDTCASGTT